MDSFSCLALINQGEKTIEPSLPTTCKYKLDCDWLHSLEVRTPAFHAGIAGFKSRWSHQETKFLYNNAEHGAFHD